VVINKNGSSSFSGHSTVMYQENCIKTKKRNIEKKTIEKYPYELFLTCSIFVRERGVFFWRVLSIECRSSQAQSSVNEFDSKVYKSRRFFTIRLCKKFKDTRNEEFHTSTNWHVPSIGIQTPQDRSWIKIPDVACSFSAIETP
jgi:hypothetical protein